MKAAALIIALVLMGGTVGGLLLGQRQTVPSNSRL